MFIVEPATPANPAGLNEKGGFLTTSETDSETQGGQVIESHTSQTIVPEQLSDFGVTVTDSSGLVLATRQLVVLNAPSTRIGTAYDPVIVVVNEGVSVVRWAIHLTLA